MERHTRPHPQRPPSPTESIVQAVAAAADTDPLELPPLYERVDADALDAVVSGLRNGEVRFRYAGYAVTVHSDGTVEVDDDSTTDSEQLDAVADE